MEMKITNGHQSRKVFFVAYDFVQNLTELIFSLSVAGRRTPAKKVQQTSDAIILDTEAAVMANFEFLGPTEMSDDDEISDDLEMVDDGDDEADIKRHKRIKSGKDMLTEGK